MSTKPAVIAAVEGGGTSFRVAICQVTYESEPTLLYRTKIDSSGHPDETLSMCAQFLKEHRPSKGHYDALGIASFGPVGVKPEEETTYGRILESSPKVQWRNVDLLGPLHEACGVRTPVKFETDVNAPALAEYTKEKGRMSSLAYVTVGTGVGVGLVVNGKCVHGKMHPEGGHVPVQPILGDSFGGYSWGEKCPFHGKNTVEGLASSVALTERLEKLQPQGSIPLNRGQLEDLPDDHDIWDHAANAIANLCVTLQLVTSVEKIVLGGGVMLRSGLLENIRVRAVELLNGYLPLDDDPDLSGLIVKSDAGNDAGLVGAIALSKSAWTEDSLGGDRDARSIKQAAFGQGLRFGLLVGSVTTAAVCKFLWRPSKR